MLYCILGVNSSYDFIESNKVAMPRSLREAAERFWSSYLQQIRAACQLLQAVGAGNPSWHPLASPSRRPGHATKARVEAAGHNGDTFDWKTLSVGQHVDSLRLGIGGWGRNGSRHRRTRSCRRGRPGCPRCVFRTLLTADSV